MKNADKDRDPARAQKRALSDARCAWRKMDTEQRAEFVRFMGSSFPAKTLPGTEEHRRGSAGIGYAKGLTQKRFDEICHLLTQLARSEGGA